MGFQDFELVGDFKARCKHCGTVLPTGLISLSDHWVKCSGKGFYDALMDSANKGELNLDKLKELENIHQPTGK